MPAPWSVLFDLICEPEIRRDPIDEFDPAVIDHPDPIPAPCPAWATILESQMFRSSIREVPPSAEYPVPIPQPRSVLFTSICESEVERDPIDELGPGPSTKQAPMPVPFPALVLTVDFQILILLMRVDPSSWASVVPMPEPHAVLVAAICESKIPSHPIEEFEPLSIEPPVPMPEPCPA
jgi:hypothetical protein